MKDKLKALWQQLLQSPRRFPVETALGVVFFILAEVMKYGSDDWMHEHGLNTEILFMFVPLVCLSFWLQRINKWAYYTSFFLFVPLLFVKSMPDGAFLAFSWLLGLLLLVLGSRKMDNRTFVAHAIPVIRQLGFGLLIAGVLSMAILAIYFSIFFLFGLKGEIIEEIMMFIWLVIAPQICFTLVREGEDEVNEPGKILTILFNYILSPAVIIYTAILYVYFITIAIAWDLPKGNVAWMVIGFISVALVGLMSQSVLTKRYYDWYYRYFTWIALPPLVMYWVGSLYRIRLYSFTDSRWYLLVAGLLMTLYVLMLLNERTRRYQLMALIMAVAIILSTYVPGISAHDIGLRCQTQRMLEIADELQILDPETGELTDKELDLSAIQQDSLLCERYREECDIIRYVRENLGNDEFKNIYGEWEYDPYDFHYNRIARPACERWYYRQNAVNLGEYTIVPPIKKYLTTRDSVDITIKHVNDSDTTIVFYYPLDSIFRSDPEAYLRNPEPLFTYRNDSILLVLHMIYVSDSTLIADTYRAQFFRKAK